MYVLNVNYKPKHMKNTILIILVLLFAAPLYSCTRESDKQKTTTASKNDPINIYSMKVRTIDGQEKSLSDYKGKVLLIVNVASKCGYTPQYEGLEKIYEKYKDRGFEILAFPCNDFGGQEPGTNEEIRDFCKTNYNVNFTLFDKIKVLGAEKSELYSKLINFEPAGDISWNFEKFLIDKNGNVAGRYKSKVKPESEELTSAIESKL
jgi:glutathione peroxidase